MGSTTPPAPSLPVPSGESPSFTPLPVEAPGVPQEASQLSLPAPGQADLPARSGVFQGPPEAGPEEPDQHLALLHRIVAALEKKPEPQTSRPAAPTQLSHLFAIPPIGR